MNNKQVLPRRKWEFNEEIPEGMKEEYCPVCQLTLSSRIVAISHYKGKIIYVKNNSNTNEKNIINRDFHFKIGFGLFHIFLATQVKGIRKHAVD